jgi:DNA polymerase-3 subunit epsilon
MQELQVNSLLQVAQNFGFSLGKLSFNGVKTMSSSKNYNSNRSHEQTSKSTSSKDVLPDREVIVDSDLFGAQIVFTGALQSMDRKNAIQIAVNNGAVVSSAVSKKTNLLIVGISDLIDFNNGKKTRKLADAENLKLQGQDISIIDEEDFLRMASY